MRHDNEIFIREFPAFADLFSAYGFQILDSMYDENTFGNTEVHASSPELRLRLTKDRGEVAVAVAPLRKDSWYPLQDVVAFIEGRKLEFREIDVPELVIALEQNYRAIQDVLLNDDRLSELEAQEKEKELGFMSSLFGKNRRTN